MNNNGDGSSSPRFFRSEEDAENAAKDDDERHCDDIMTETLVFDENGVLLRDDAEKQKETDAAWSKVYDLQQKVAKEKDATKKAELKKQLKEAEDAWALARED